MKLLPYGISGLTAAVLPLLCANGKVAKYVFHGPLTTSCHIFVEYWLKFDLMDHFGQNIKHFLKFLTTLKNLYSVSG